MQIEVYYDFGVNNIRIMMPMLKCYQVKISSRTKVLEPLGPDFSMANFFQHKQREKKTFSLLVYLAVNSHLTPTSHCSLSHWWLHGLPPLVLLHSLVWATTISNEEGIGDQHGKTNNMNTQKQTVIVNSLQFCTAYWARRPSLSFISPLHQNHL